MSGFTIAHDIPGRMRIRYGKNKFSSVQGEVLKKDLYAWPMIESVEVNNVTGSVLMLYDKAQKGLLLNKLKDLDIKYLQNADTSSIVVHSQSPEAIAMNREYMNRFFKIIGKRYFIKWFLPMGLGNAITIYKSMHFIKEGLASRFSNVKNQCSFIGCDKHWCKFNSKELYDCWKYYDVTKYFGLVRGLYA